MKLFKALLFIAAPAMAQLSYPPDADTAGTTAIPAQSSLFTAWATGIEVTRGFIQIDDESVTYNGSNKATYGSPDDAVGPPGSGAVSLGDGGFAIATFTNPVGNGDGFDFAVFENGISNTFLELAFVEVSSDGVNYFRFPSHSETQTQTPIGGFGALDARNLNNLAGKYKAGFGTPFDLSDLPDNPLLNKNAITHIKIIDVVGTLNPQYATYDSYGNMINDQYPTPFHSGGFDLTGIGVINQGQLQIADNSIKGFSVYPNPAADTVYFTCQNQGIATFYDMAGRSVLTTNIQDKTAVDISALQAGMYTVTVNSNTTQSTVKLVVKK